MENLHNWPKVFEQLVVSVAEILKFLYFFLKELEDSIGGLAILECLGKWILGQVYSSVLAIVSQGRVENDFEVGRGDHCRGHGIERKCWLRRAMEGDTELRIWILGRTATSYWMGLGSGFHGQ
jgi:hypothetical protein